MYQVFISQFCCRIQYFINKFIWNINSSNSGKILAYILHNRLRNNSNQRHENDTDYVPSSIKIDFFSGYDVMLVNGLYGKQNSFGGWTHEHKHNSLLIHLKKVSITCQSLIIKSKFWHNEVNFYLSLSILNFYIRLVSIAGLVSIFNINDTVILRIFIQQKYQYFQVPNWETQ